MRRRRFVQAGTASCRNGYASIADRGQRFGTYCRQVDALIERVIQFGDEHNLVSFNKIEPKRYLLDAFFHAVHTFLCIRENNVGLLIISSHYAHYGTSILENEENAIWGVEKVNETGVRST